MKRGRFFLLLALVVGGFFLAKNVLALDTGTNVISNTIQLGASDPRTIVARIINVAMMFLGIVAIGIIIFAGFKWMTSNGNEEQIESAKKILKAGVIGLVIILASWGIAAFILSRLMGATGSNGTGNNGGGGGNLPPCSGNGCAGMACDDQPLVVGCQFSTSSCQAGLACEPTSCTCQPCPQNDPNCATNSGGNYGDACDGDLTNNDPNPTCDADNTMCDAGQGLTCEPTSCTCLGSPVITDISPVGGFCEGNVNLSCSTDTDCASSGPCNINAPNGAPENIISIHGYNFGNPGTSTSFNTYQPNNFIAKVKQFFNLGVAKTKAAGLSQVIFLGDENNNGDDQIALNPTEINPVCIDSWTNNEIIIAIPNSVVTGPIKVVNGNLNSNLIDFDTTNDTTGPQIPNFVPNTIVRPGICFITPTAGALGDEVSYYGNNLSGAGYFGNDSNKFKGISSTFNSANTSGSVLVPNVGAGYMSTFVVNPTDQKSNYVTFKKNQEPPLPPSISGFEPESGSAGQYVTIRGNGFGNARNSSQVFFGSTEADYNFPAACLHSVWKDNQVIVKVPVGLADGPYTIKMKIGNWDEISSADTFTADSAAPLLPSLCKIEPSRGPANAQVSFYGDYFSSSTNGVARFYNQKDATGLITTVDGANKLKANVPMDAVTGPVKIVDNSRIGNSLNFMVGACTNSSECDSGTPYCCPFGSPKQGQCAIALMDSNSGCYSSVPTSVFEWKFGTSLAVPCDGDLTNNDPTPTCDATNQLCSNINTFCDANSCTCQPCPPNDPNCGIGACGNGGQTCDPNDALCSMGYVCDPNSCNCAESFYSCAQKGGGSSCPIGFCPNSPGQCSPYEGGNTQTIGSCHEDCSSYLGCTGGNCSYDPSINKCVDNNYNCSYPESFPYTLGVDPYTTDYVAERVCVQQGTDPHLGHWRIATSSVCPDGWTNIGGNKCDLLTEDCSVCSAGFSCNSDGRCVNNSVVCAAGAVCQGTECKREDLATCECCCEIGQDARDCCAPLTCAGSCGNGAYTDGNGATHDFGKCSGCMFVGGTQDDHDAACNCAGTNGKYCEDDGGSGVCVDCTSLNGTDCINHASTCCWDDKDNTCRGGDGEVITSNPGGKYGHCAFYACASTTNNSCATSSPNIYSTSTSVLANHIFKNSNQCSGCTTVDPNLGCSLTIDPNACKTKSGCCWDLGATTTPKCMSGNKVPSTGDVPGACDYYSCQTGQNSDICATSTPSSVGTYPTLSSCSSGCNTPHLGASCNTSATTTSSCNVSVCGGPFACMTSNPFGIISSSTPGLGGCGTCCCSPTNDTCGQINPLLSCIPDRGSCSGASRGLCCGCQNDSQCGDYNTNGCSFDSCCHARPEVVSTNPGTTPTDDLNVCRNAIISVTFNEKMDNTSLTGNVVLLAESANSTCPAGTSHLTPPSGGNQFFSEQIMTRLINWFNGLVNRIARLFGSNQAMAYSIANNKTYCVTPGVTTYETTGSNTIVRFTPTNVLEPDTNYIALVRGQEILTSLASSTALGKGGVLNFYKVGMAESGLENKNVGTPQFGPFGANGPTFTNSYSWHFKTLNDNNATAGICLVDRVELSPQSYIFQKNTADLVNENDVSSINPTFDTVADGDKLYVAQALSSDGQELQPIPTYDWVWNWSISDQNKINFASGTDLPGTGNRRLLKVETGVTDAVVTVTATTNMTPGNAYPTPNKSKSVPSRVFVCLNPWPPVNNIYQWEPSRDVATFGNFTYEFYYCRDAGDPNSTLDDLPAISSGADIINLGLSNRKVCSDNRSLDCTDDPTVCATGAFCIPDILKESYFFQQ